uniref:hypothetical protein n=1 Tax=Acetatifactor sp. TaxID=1872090 RepID=UPI004056E9C7
MQISIGLGMNKEAVESVIGKGQFVGERYYYFNNEMAIEYTNNKMVRFIEFLGGIYGSLRPMIYCISVFDNLADEVETVLRDKNSGKIDDSEQGYSYRFYDISVGVYRERIPEDIKDMIEDMKSDGIPIEDNEDLKEEIRRANHWAAIGIGVKYL